MPEPVNGRRLAARVLERVLGDAAFAAAALDAELARHPELDPRERGLTTELVYGVLRTRSALEAQLFRFASRKVKDQTTLVHLLIGAYQLLVLTRVPAFAAVNAAVSAVRAERGPKMAGFVNAVLRKLAREGVRLESSAVAGAPPWLFERLSEAVGSTEAIALLGGGERARTTAFRVVEGRPLPAFLQEAERGRVSPRARRAPRSGDPRALAGYDEGSFVIQEEGSQAIALLLGARPGERILDACAGRGQKASLIAEQLGPEGELWAADAHPNKLDALGREFDRLKLPRPQTRAVDWTLGTADVPEGFDRVLVDAPCSGSGTLVHRPEILLRLSPEDPARLGELATTILRSAATRARPSGRVLFAVCSVFPEEAEEVVSRVLDLLEPCGFDAPELDGVVPADATSIRLLPIQHGTDGYFAASFRRKT